MKVVLKHTLAFFFFPAYSKRTEADDDAPLRATTAIIAWLLKMQISFLTTIFVCKIAKVDSFLLFMLITVLCFAFWEWFSHSIIHLNKFIYSMIERHRVRQLVEGVMINQPIIGYTLATISIIVSCCYLVWFMFHSAILVFNK